MIKRGFPLVGINRRALMIFGFILAIIAALIVSQVFIAPPKVRAAWYTTGGTWQYRKSITIDRTKVASATLTDFPVLISLTTDTELASYAQTDFDDVLFTSSDGSTKLSHEIEQFNESTGNLVAWVKAPSINWTTDVVLYMYYGNASATNQQNATDVWSNGYAGVWHLSENPAGTAPQMLDSTSNNNDGTSNGSMTSGQQVPGKIGGSITLDGSNDFINFPDHNSLDFGLNDDFTLEVWIKSTQVPASSLYPAIMMKGHGSAGLTGYRLLLSRQPAAPKWGTELWDNTSIVGGAEGPNTVYDDNWHSLEFSRNNGDLLSNAEDGVGYASELQDPGSEISLANAHPLRFGTDAGANNTYDYAGGLDEARVSTVERTLGWVTTEHNNQNSPSTFYTLGAQEIPRPETPTLSAPSSGTTIITLTPTFQFRAADPTNSYLRYEIMLYQSDCSTQVGTAIDQNTSQTGWSGQDLESGTAYTGNSTEASSTLATYVYQGSPALSWGTTYCWKARAKDPGDTNTFGPYSATRLFTINAIPAAPTLYQPIMPNGEGIYTLPQFHFKSTDANSDYLMYKLDVCTDVNCNTILRTIDQTLSQTGWSSQNASSNTAYTAHASNIDSSRTAVHSYQTPILSEGTQYWWRAYAKDPAGSNLWSSASSIQTFYTAAPPASVINISPTGGNINIYGGTTIEP